MELFPSILAFVTGLVLGSFFNVLIYRLPREESIVRPGSRCTACGHPLRWWQNIPLLSYALLRGKCAYCGSCIAVRYPLVELLTGCAAVVVWMYHVVPRLSVMHSPWEIPAIAVESLTLLVLIPISIIDLEHYIIPDLLTIPGLAAAVVVSFFPGGPGPLQCLLGIILGGGSLLTMGLIGTYVFKKQDAMGGGDVRLMAYAGALWGWEIALAGIFAASMLGSIVGLAMLANRRLSKDHRLPFGPFLATGIWISVLLQKVLHTLYLRWIDGVFPS